MFVAMGAPPERSPRTGRRRFDNNRKRASSSRGGVHRDSRSNRCAGSFFLVFVLLLRVSVSAFGVRVKFRRNEQGGADAIRFGLCRKVVSPKRILRVAAMDEHGGLDQILPPTAHRPKISPALRPTEKHEPGDDLPS